MSKGDRPPITTIITPALLGAIAGGAAYQFVNGQWDSQGWLAVALMALICVIVHRRNRAA
jgi:hypothetical protein